MSTPLYLLQPDPPAENVPSHNYGIDLCEAVPTGGLVFWAPDPTRESATDVDHWLDGSWHPQLARMAVPYELQAISAPARSFEWEFTPGRDVGNMDIYFRCFATFDVVAKAKALLRATALSGTSQLPGKTPVKAKLKPQRATDAAALTKQIKSLLPEVAEGTLASLIGVSRVTWRDWDRGIRSPHPERQRRLIRLLRILQVRRRIAPETSLSLWLETPIGHELEMTPRALLEQGRDDVVASLAAQAESASGDAFRVEPLRLGGLLNTARSDEELLDSRVLSQEDSRKDP